MKNNIEEISNIKDISCILTTENKKYVIAVANALLFSQEKNKKPHKPQDKKPEKATL